MLRQSCFLSRLVINSEINPRSATGDVSDLKAQILSQGFTDPLWVRPFGNLYEIIDGSRRFRALCELVDEGKLDAGTEIAVDVFEVDDAQARDMALAANVVRSDLSPADEAMGFYRLKLSGVTEEQIAARYAQSPRLVAQRIRIGSLPQPILDSLRSGAISIATAEAFTLTPSAERQLEVFETLKSGNGRALSQHFVREALLSEKVSHRSAEASFVGEDEYVNAGGMLTRDLFSEDMWFDDGALLRQLFETKIERTVRGFKDEGFAFVDVISRDTWKISSWERIEPKGKLTAEQKAHNTDLQAKIDELQKKLDAIEEEADDHDVGTEKQAEASKLEDRIDELNGQIISRPFTANQKAECGVAILIQSGGVEIVQGLVKPSAKGAASKPSSKPGKADGDDAAPEPAEVAGYTDSAMDMMRVAAEQATKLAMLSVKPALAARLYLAARITDAWSGFSVTPFRVKHTDSTSGHAYLEQYRDRFADLFRGCAGEFEQIFERLETLSAEQIVQIEAALAAECFHVSALRNQDARAIIERIDPDMLAEDWQPDETFLKMLGREQLSAIITECGAPAPAKTKKKGDLVALALPLIEANGWLPEPLRFGSYKGPGSGVWADTRAEQLADEIKDQEKAA